jgi:hypothetical protein
MFPIQLFDISDEGQADKEVPMGVGAKLKLRKLPKPLKASHIMGPRVILAAMGIGMGELFNKYIDPWASTIFFLVAFVQIWNTGFGVYDGYARGQADILYYNVQSTRKIHLSKCARIHKGAQFHSKKLRRKKRRIHIERENQFECLRLSNI